MTIQILWTWACIPLIASKGIDVPAKISTPEKWAYLLTTSDESCTIGFRPNAPDIFLQYNYFPGPNPKEIAQVYLRSPQNSVDKCALQTNGKALKTKLATQFTWTDCSASASEETCADPRISKFQSEGLTLVALSWTLTATTELIDCKRQGLVVQPTLVHSNCHRRDSSGPTGPTGFGGQNGATGPTGQKGQAGSTGSSGQPGYSGQRPPCPSQTRRRVRIAITNGTSTVTVGQPLTCDDREYTLPISDLGTGADFYIQEYRSSAVGANGTVETVTAYTVQNVQSGQYLVADVLVEAKLNVENSSPGINLENELNFPFGYAKFADYRLFASYETNTGDGIILCPLFHRTNCLLPVNKGYLRLASLKGSGSPTASYSFNNPRQDDISSFLRTSATRSGLVGEWYFKFVDAPKPSASIWRH